MFWPDKTCEFGNLVIGGKRGDIADFRDNTSCINFTNTRNRSKSVRKRFKFLFDSFINKFKRIFKSADVADKLSDDEMISRSKLGP